MRRRNGSGVEDERAKAAQKDEMRPVRVSRVNVSCDTLIFYCVNSAEVAETLLNTYYRIILLYFFKDLSYDIIIFLNF